MPLVLPLAALSALSAFFPLVGAVVAGIVGAFVAVPLRAVAVSVTKSLRADESPLTSAVN